MMKKLLVGTAAVAMLSTAAMASVMIAEIPDTSTVGNWNRIGGMSADGSVVAVSRFSAAENKVSPELYYVNSGAFVRVMTTGGGVGVTDAGARGVGAAPGLAPVTAIHDRPDWGNVLTIAQGTGPAQYTSPHGRFGLNNTVSLNSDGDGWVVGGIHNSDQAAAWQVTGGVVNTTATYANQFYPGRNTLNGVSHTGLAVGQWRASVGGGAHDRALLYDVTPGNEANRRALNLEAVGGVNRGMGHGVSGDGAFAVGYAWTDDASHGTGWRLDINDFPATDGTYTRLYPFGYDPTKVQQSNALDVANDGTAVGFSFGDGVTSAAVWAAGSDQAILLYDWLVDLGVDMSGWDSLTHALAISEDGLTIAGQGNLAGGGGAAAFVAVVPEPATLSFLALGGLALLRRRR